MPRPKVLESDIDLILGSWSVLVNRRNMAIFRGMDLLSRLLPGSPGLDLVTWDLDPSKAALTLTLKCTEYDQGSCGWLDHIIVSLHLADAESASTVVTGSCAISEGARLDVANMPLAYHALSDHCVLVTEIRNQDRD